MKVGMKRAERNPPKLLRTKKRYLKPWKEEQIHPVVRLSPTTYRMIVMPTFQPARLFRITRPRGGWEIVAKIRGGLAGYFMGELIWQAKRWLKGNEARHLDELVRRLCFWDMPHKEWRMALDPTVCVFEGIRAGRYCAVECLLEEPFTTLFHYLDTVTGARTYLTSSRKAQENMRQAMEKIEKVAREISGAPRTVARAARLNKVALRLSLRAPKEGLVCPHCHTLTRRMRFIDRNPEGLSFFICGVCAQSFDAEQHGTLKVFKRRAKRIAD